MVQAERVTEILREVAETIILPRFRTLADREIHEKCPGQWVTVADTEAERSLGARLTALLVGSCAVGEESVADDPNVLERLDMASPVWVIDPLDGTANFIRGRTRFAMAVALVVDGETRMGWIHDPLSGRTAVAARGQGAWLDGQRLRLETPPMLSRMIGSVRGQRAAALTGKVGGVLRQGSAAHDYLDLVEGRMHFAHFRKLLCWDHAAGVLLHAEAGGCGVLTDGRPYGARRSAGRLLLAPDHSSWETLRELIEQEGPP